MFLNYFFKVIIGFILVAHGLTGGVRLVFAEERPSAAMVFVDVLPTRIVGVAATLVGAGLFVITFPFTAVAGPEDALFALVIDPFRYTFVRPLGKFSHWEASTTPYFDVPPEQQSSSGPRNAPPEEETPDF